MTAFDPFSAVRDVGSSVPRRLARIAPSLSTANVSGAADSDDAVEEPYRPEDWLSAAETIRLVRTTTLSPNSHIILATRAHFGLIRTRADFLTAERQREADLELPAAFWWAKGNAALSQDWETGDFHTSIDDRRFYAFGVRFHKGDLRRMIPAAFEVVKPDPPNQDPSGPAKAAGGRRMSALWPDWVAEVVSYYHECGIPDGTGSVGAEKFISTIADRLAERGLEAPPRTTVQETVNAILRRMRGAEN